MQRDSLKRAHRFRYPDNLTGAVAGTLTSRFCPVMRAWLMLIEIPRYIHNNSVAGAPLIEQRFCRSNPRGVVDGLEPPFLPPPSPPLPNQTAAEVRLSF